MMHFPTKCLPYRNGDALVNMEPTRLMAKLTVIFYSFQNCDKKYQVVSSQHTACLERGNSQTYGRKYI